MCGIHVIIDKIFSLAESNILYMAEALQYRGPDAVNNITISSNRQKVYIAQNRLRITDLHPSADKLFQSQDGRYTLAYNGEIYNYKLLRKDLEKRHHFKTHTDTEVLLYLLIEEGIQSLRKINGMFAFAFYDQRKEKLLLCRDKFGMKPLYYAENEKYLVVSSEIRGILASGIIEKKLNSSQIAPYLRFKFAQRPHTFFENIYECMPGQAFQAEPGQVLSKSDPVPAYQMQLPETITTQHIENTLVASVERHLQTEVPYGLFLSGGVDSTLLLAISQELGYKHLPVFSISNAENETSFGTKDYQFARLAAKQFGADYHELQVARTLLDNFHGFLKHVDQPIGDSAVWLTFLLAQAAQPHIKVVLSGAGADELFAGYHRHWAYYQYLKHYRWIKPLFPALKKITFLLPTGRKHPLRQSFRLAHKMFRKTSASPEETFLNFTAHLPFPSHEPLATKSYSKQKNTEFYLKQALHYDQANFLSADVLALTDRMTMQASLEARLPYLDAELSTLMESLPACFLLKKGRKWILKDILVRKGGDIYAKRRKEGFGMPFGQWLKTPQGKLLVNLLQNHKCITYNFISFDKVNQILKAHLAGKTDYSSELWTLSLVIAWIEKEFGITYTS